MLNYGIIWQSGDNTMVLLSIGGVHLKKHRRMGRNTNRPSSAVTHTISYWFGNTSGAIATNVGASVSWTPPLSLASQIPNATSGVCTITCNSFVNGTLTGTRTCTLTLTVPSSVVPTIFCKSCGCRLCYQHNVLRRKLADGTLRVYERHQFRCYRKISSRHSCNGPSSYEADPIIAAVESEIRSFLARIHSTPEEKLVSVACSRNAEMYEIAYRQAVKDYEKAQKQVNALEEEAVKALTGESQLDLKVVNAMLLKHREKLEAAQREMEETRNRVEQEDQNKKATKAQVDELRTWGEIYDGAKAEIRHMIIGRLVERIDVEEGNKITIKYRVSFEQFMNKEQASA